MPTRRAFLRTGGTASLGLLHAGLAHRGLAYTGLASPIPRGVPGERVRTGLEMLAAEDFRRLKGLRVGLVTNPTGILPDLTSNVEALHAAPGVHLRALFGPEHGVRGDVPAGDPVAGARDAQTGLPAYSLYGPTRVPTAEMLKGLDVLVFDIQDIGARSYTYLSTLGCVLEAASRHQIPVIVLDRPNPVGLTAVEGGPPRAGFFSFVGKYPVASRHGMTLGELARMIVGQGWLPGGKPCDLTVVPCTHLTRAQATWESFGGLPWAPTSPQIPHPKTAYFYAATGITGELATLSIGVGCPLPFELIGVPGVGPVSLARELTRRALPGMAFRPATWTPEYAPLQAQSCGGVQIYLDEGATGASLTRLNFEILDALRALVPHRPLWADAEAVHLFDLDCGTDRVRKAFIEGAHAADLWGIFNTGRDAFAAARKPYLLYE